MFNSKKVIVRACVGCILPKKSKIIGSGDYTIILNSQKIVEQYYDYVINEKDLDEFLSENREILLQNNLLTEE